MVEAVPARVVGRVAEAEVRPEVDDRACRRRRTRRPARRRRRGAGRGTPPRRLGDRRVDACRPVVARCGWIRPIGVALAARARRGRRSRRSGCRASSRTSSRADVPGRADDRDADRVVRRGGARPGGRVPAAVASRRRALTGAPSPLSGGRIEAARGASLRRSVRRTSSAHDYTSSTASSCNAESVASECLPARQRGRGAQSRRRVSPGSGPASNGPVAITSPSTSRAGYRAGSGSDGGCRGAGRQHRLTGQYLIAESSMQRRMAASVTAGPSTSWTISIA